jgi:hypothetical protein
MAKICEACGNKVFRDSVIGGKDFFVCVNPKCARYKVSLSGDGEEANPKIIFEKDIKERETAL